MTDFVPVYYTQEQREFALERFKSTWTFIHTGLNKPSLTRTEKKRLKTALAVLESCLLAEVKR